MRIVKSFSGCGLDGKILSKAIRTGRRYFEGCDEDHNMGS